MNTTGPKTPPRAANPTSQPYALLPRYLCQPPAGHLCLSSSRPWFPDTSHPWPPVPLWLGRWPSTRGRLCLFRFLPPNSRIWIVPGQTSGRSKLYSSSECLSDEPCRDLTHIQRSRRSFHTPTEPTISPQVPSRGVPCMHHSNKRKRKGKYGTRTGHAETNALIACMHFVSASNIAKKRIPRLLISNLSQYHGSRPGGMGMGKHKPDLCHSSPGPGTYFNKGRRSASSVS